MQAFADRAALSETMQHGWDLSLSWIFFAYDSLIHQHTLVTFSPGPPSLATFYSRSRKGRWCKGETSGHFIHVKGVFVDCDRDSIIYLSDPIGPSCHTGARCGHDWGPSERAYIQTADDFLISGAAGSPRLNLMELQGFMSQAHTSTQSTSLAPRCWLSSEPFRSAKRPCWQKRVRESQFLDICGLWVLYHGSEDDAQEVKYVLGLG